MIRLALTTCAVAIAAVVAPMKWTAHLSPQGGSKIDGQVVVTPDGPNKMTVKITIASAEPGHVYPWHIHTGKCGPGGVYGPGSAYTPIKADPYGAATLTVTVPVAAPESGDYHVNIHASPTDMSTIVSCGDLTMQM
jgi:hypothetical protein